LHKPFEVKINTSEYAFGKQLDQQNNQERLRIISNFSKKLNSSEINYGIPD
ncbi:hypothetical protein M406DRAFT_251087, partial [Cryphonectria parasitica EP155]